MGRIKVEGLTVPREQPPLPIDVIVTVIMLAVCGWILLDLMGW